LKAIIVGEFFNSLISIFVICKVKVRDIRRMLWAVGQGQPIASEIVKEQKCENNYKKTLVALVNDI